MEEDVPRPLPPPLEVRPTAPPPEWYNPRTGLYKGPPKSPRQRVDVRPRQPFDPSSYLPLPPSPLSPAEQEPLQGACVEAKTLQQKLEQLERERQNRWKLEEEQAIRNMESRTLMSLILTPMQELMWRSRWEDGVQRVVVANLSRAEGDPLRLATMEMLSGTGPFTDAQLQARLDVTILQQSAELAREALRTLPEDGKVTPPDRTIKQGPSSFHSLPAVSLSATGAQVAPPRQPPNHFRVGPQLWAAALSIAPTL
ncbi:uncharacterized protein LOC134525383 [Chroicocephalus ridibundus]|uniref:uncharacterized protein LOC134525383 n=1 Tax=Chroicocephalus ridibundus TaxID=1192867 RepID=UPI002FDDCCF9